MLDRQDLLPIRPGGGVITCLQRHFPQRVERLVAPTSGERMLHDFHQPAGISPRHSLFIPLLCLGIDSGAIHRKGLFRQRRQFEMTIIADADVSPFGHAVEFAAPILHQLDEQVDRLAPLLVSQVGADLLELLLHRAICPVQLHGFRQLIVVATLLRAEHGRLPPTGRRQPSQDRRNEVRQATKYWR